MKIFDISQPIPGCAVYPGDPAPEMQALCRISDGQVYNLTAFSMCAHNGTHVDAPFHCLQDGKTVEQMAPDTFVGACYVARHTGDVTAADAEAMLVKAADAQRLLIAGAITVTAEAAAVLQTAPSSCWATRARPWDRRRPPCRCI